MTDFLDSLKQGLSNVKGRQQHGFTSKAPEFSCQSNSTTSQDYPVLAEIPIRSTDLHYIANGRCCTLFDGALGIRFLLKDSFKIKKNNFVINNLIMQIVAVGKYNTMHREDIGVRTKVKTVIRKKVIIKKPEKIFSVTKMEGVKEL